MLNAVHLGWLFRDYFQPCIFVLHRVSGQRMSDWMKINYIICCNGGTCYLVSWLVDVFLVTPGQQWLSVAATAMQIWIFSWYFFWQQHVLKSSVHLSFKTLELKKNLKSGIWTTYVGPCDSLVKSLTISMCSFCTRQFFCSGFPSSRDDNVIFCSLSGALCFPNTSFMPFHHCLSSWLLCFNFCPYFSLNRWFPVSLE